MVERKQAGKYIFEIYEEDHPPLHVHIFVRVHKVEKRVGRWDIENQRPMSKFKIGRALRRDLRQCGYLREAGDD